MICLIQSIFDYLAADLWSRMFALNYCTVSSMVGLVGPLLLKIPFLARIIVIGVVEQ